MNGSRRPTLVLVFVGVQSINDPSLPQKSCTAEPYAGVHAMHVFYSVDFTRFYASKSRNHDACLLSVPSTPPGYKWSLGADKLGSRATTLATYSVEFI